jgi:microfibrillar-associated protein 1
VSLKRSERTARETRKTAAKAIVQELVQSELQAELEAKAVRASVWEGAVTHSSLTFFFLHHPQHLQRLVDDEDGEDAEGEFEAWKVRELLRMKRDREEREEMQRERLENERVHNMTDKEREAYFEEHGRVRVGQGWGVLVCGWWWVGKQPLTLLHRRL